MCHSYTFPLLKTHYDVYYCGYLRALSYSVPTFTSYIAVDTHVNESTA